MGYGWAITSLLGLSLISMWTQHLLIALHAEYRMRLSQDKEHPRHGDEDYIASYHEVFGYLMNKWWGRLSVVIVFLALLWSSVWAWAAGRPSRRWTRRSRSSSCLIDATGADLTATPSS